MAVRVLRCSKCDGEKRDEKGNRCHECNGEGFFLYGVDRDREEVVAELGASRRFRDEDKAELSRAQGRMRICPAPQRGGLHKQIEHLRGAVAYWEARVKVLEGEVGDGDHLAGVVQEVEERFTLEAGR